MTEVEAEALETAITRAVGEELRRVREARGWSRAQFVKRLPSGIGDRTYTHLMPSSADRTKNVIGNLYGRRPETDSDGPDTAQDDQQAE